MMLLVGSAPQANAQDQGSASIRLKVPVDLQGLSPGIYDSFQILCSATTRVLPIKYAFGHATQTFTDSFDGTVAVQVLLTTTQVGEVWDYSCQLLLHTKATGATVIMASGFAINSRTQGLIRGSFTV
ncbi:MAG TPA: hypothetical protein VGO46_04360 [Gemmatimonadaceae bacterium]|nr:hypothetical protein [Gemmatimonadaceae bacterium]